MECFLECSEKEKAKGKVLCLKSLGGIEEGLICQKCAKSAKEYCKDCRGLKLVKKIIWDFNRDCYCLNCYKVKDKKCSGCDTMCIFFCTCGILFCRLCAEKHFLAIPKGAEHFFYINSEEKFIVPDFNTPDICLTKNPRLLTYISQVDNFFQLYQNMALAFPQSNRKIPIHDEIFGLLGLYKTGVKNLKLTSVPKEFSYLEYDFITYYCPKSCSRLLSTDINPAFSQHFECKPIDLIRIRSYIKYANLQKPITKNYKAKKLKYAILNNLYPSLSTLKAIITYFEITKDIKLNQQLFRFIKIHFQDSFDMIRIITATGKYCHLIQDFNNSMVYFKKSIEVASRKFPLDSQYMSVLQFYYARSLKYMNKKNESKFLFKVVIRNSWKNCGEKLIKRCLLELQPMIDESELPYFDYYYSALFNAKN